MILLIPIGFLAHLGFGLYFVFAIASNVVISRSPKLALRLERWGAPIALFFAKRSKDTSSVPNGTGGVNGLAASDGLERPWPQRTESHLVGTSVVLVCAIAGWCIALVFLVILTMPTQGRLWILLVAVVFAALASWPTFVVIRRKRREI